MTSSARTLPPGYSDVAPGHVASVVTCLEMREKPQTPVVPLPDDIALVKLQEPDLAAYRALFRKVGSAWLWYSRLLMDDETLLAILRRESVDIYVIQQNGADIGMLELDFSEPGECELGFLGLTPDATGKGLGRAIMNKAIGFAWSRPIQRFWVHTCTFDHPSALGFYIRSGFQPYAFQVEVQKDPRLTGHLPPDAAPHIPLIRPSGYPNA